MKVITDRPSKSVVFELMASITTESIAKEDIVFLPILPTRQRNDLINLVRVVNEAAEQQRK